MPDHRRYWHLLVLNTKLRRYCCRHMRVLVLLLHSFWIPQILYCARTDSRQPLGGAFVGGMTLSRLALPLYLFGCPHNLLRLPPNFSLCVLLILYMGAQVGAASAVALDVRWSAQQYDICSRPWHLSAQSSCMKLAQRLVMCNHSSSPYSLKLQTIQATGVHQ